MQPLHSKIAATSTHLSDHKPCLRSKIASAYRIVKNLGREALNKAKRAKQCIQKLASRWFHDQPTMAIDTVADHQIYDIKEAYRRCEAGFEAWSFDTTYESFDNEDNVAEAKAILTGAKSLLEASDPKVVDVETLWDLSHTQEWSEFLEGNMQSESQKELKQEVDAILALLRRRRTKGANTLCFFFPLE